MAQPDNTGRSVIPSQPANLTSALFAISVFGLFLELLLIRWVTTEIRIFAYLQNTVLVVCFLGLGMGCLNCRKPFSLREVLIPLLVLASLLAIPVTRIALGRISEMLSGFSDLVIWEAGSTAGREKMLAGPLGLGLTFMLMVLIWEIFVPIGRLLGQLLDDHPRPIYAYSVNIAGSLVGIWLFVLLSFSRLPPVVWFGVAGLSALYFLPKGRARLTDLALIVAVVACGWFAGREPGSMEVVWSSYQKLDLSKIDELRSTSASASESMLRGQRFQKANYVGEYLVTVNNAGYQVMIDHNPERMAQRAAQDPKVFPPDQLGYSQYDLPPLLHPSPRKMLVVGAGSGNDVAGCLRHGAQEVVAVEIDPVIIDFGRRFHPEQPYSSPKVRVVADDARSFFANANEKFDVIVFGLLDSHTTTAMTNARLDHYVYTRESLEQAKHLLADGGIVVLSFEAQKPYIADRMGRTLRECFGREPICFRVPTNGFGWGGVTFICADLETAHRQIEARPKLAGLIAEWQKENPIELTGTTSIATDDWPYIYLETPRIPVLYYLLAVVLVILFVRGIRRLKSPEMIRHWDRTSLHFFFLGAAFMLLETQNISKASVALGNTWLVNAVIITGILAMVLVSNAIAARWPNLPVGGVYVALLGTCLGLYAIDLSIFTSLPYTARAFVVGGLTSLPMLFSGLVFIRSFATVRRKDLALGANLMGALVGGLLQSVTFLTGIQALLLIVAGLYGAAFLSRPNCASKVQENSRVAA